LQRGDYDLYNDDDDGGGGDCHLAYSMNCISLYYTYMCIIMLYGCRLSTRLSIIK